MFNFTAVEGGGSQMICILGAGSLSESHGMLNLHLIIFIYTVLNECAHRNKLLATSFYCHVVSWV